MPLFTSCLEEVFSETRLPLLAVLGSWKELEDKKEPGLLDLGLK
jgi:hypothetical protein